MYSVDTTFLILRLRNAAAAKGVILSSIPNLTLSFEFSQRNSLTRIGAVQMLYDNQNGDSICCRLSRSL